MVRTATPPPAVSGGETHLPPGRMARRIGMTAPTLAKLVRQRLLPQPVRLTKKLVLYNVAEVEAALKRLQEREEGAANVLPA